MQKSLDEICQELNFRVFDYSALIVDYSKKIPVIKVCPRLKKSLVKKYLLDDLIQFDADGPYMTTRLQNYAIEISNGEIVCTKRELFY